MKLQQEDQPGDGFEFVKQLSQNMNVFDLSVRLLPWNV